MSLTVAILCGGLGTRLAPLTNDLPKSLVPIEDKPFIDYQLRLLVKQGIERVVLCIGYRGEQIAEYVGSGQYFGLSVAYSCDGETQLGTAGAIRKALPWLGEFFGVLYGDTYPLYDLSAVWWQLGMSLDDAAAMAVRTPGRGNVHYGQGRVLAYTRGKHAEEYGDAGFSVFKGRTFPHTVESGDLGDIFKGMAAYGLLAGHEVTAPVYEVGSLDGLDAFKNYVVHERLAG